MPFAPTPYVEYPNLRVPIALIVDDPAPCINPLWYFRHQVDRQEEPAHERTIPLDFMEEWCHWVAASGIRGDFSILPYPAGLGRIDDALEGYDSGEVKAWLALARQYIVPQFDIHCEILTHTNVLDLKTGQLLAPSEHDWMASQDEATLTEYFASAMQILRDAGLPNYGLTQPCYYHGDEAMYARAILNAEKRVNGRKVTHNFLHVDSVSHCVPPRFTHLDPNEGEAVVSVWAATDDYIWNTQERGSPEQSLSPEVLADRYLTRNGQGGRLADLLRGGGPLVLVTHWQSLYSNGSRLGFRTYKEIARRVSSLLGNRVEWRKISDLANHYLAAQTAQFTATADAASRTVEVTVTAPFPTDILTVSIPMPWPLYKAPVVTVNHTTSEWVESPAELAVGRWCMRGSLVTVSLCLEANAGASVVVKS